MHRLVEAFGQVRQLAVDLHPDGLERAARRVTAPAPGGRGDAGADRVHELRARVHRASSDDGARNAARKALFAVRGDDVRQVLFGVGVQHLLRGQLLGAVHAHVERRVGPVREAALGSVDLRATQAQIEQDAHDVPLALGAHDVGEVLEPAPHDSGSSPEPVERLPSRCHGVGITVDAEQVHVCPGLEHEAGVPAAADRRVDDQPGRDRRQQLHHLPAHHRLMQELRHRLPPR